MEVLFESYKSKVLSNTFKSILDEKLPTCRLKLYVATSLVFNSALCKIPKLSFVIVGRTSEHKYVLILNTRMCQYFTRCFLTHRWQTALLPKILLSLDKLPYTERCSLGLIFVFVLCL